MLYRINEFEMINDKYVSEQRQDIQLENCENDKTKLRMTMDPQSPQMDDIDFNIDNNFDDDIEHSDMSSHKYFFSFKILKLEFTPKSAVKASICLQVGRKEIVTVNKPKIDPKRVAKGSRCTTLFKDEKLKLMSKLKSNDSNEIKEKNIYFKIILHHLKKGQSHVVGHCALNLADYVNPPSDPRNCPFEKLISLNFQKCIDKHAKLHIYLHSMRVTDQGLNLNYDIDDNMSANFSMNSGNGLQSEYNYPDSMCGSTNGDFLSSNLLKNRAKSPLEQLGTIAAPKSALELANSSSSNQANKIQTNRLSSIDRSNGTLKVSIDITKNTVKNSLGMKKAVHYVNQVKGLTSRPGNRSFNLGNMLESSKDNYGVRLDEQKADYSTNGSEVKLNELIQAENEERIKVLEKKIEEIFTEKNQLTKELQTLQFDQNCLKKERDELTVTNKILQEKINNQICDEEVKSLNEYYLNEIANLKAQRKLEIDSLRSELIKEKDKNKDLESNLLQNELKIQSFELKVRNLETSLSQKDSRGESLKSSPRKNRGTEELESEILKLTKEISLNNIKIKRSEELNAAYKKESEEKNRINLEQSQIIKELRIQLQEQTELNESKLTQRENEIKVLQKDVDFTTKRFEDEVRKSTRALKNKDIEIERLQDKIKMLEIKVDSIPSDKQSVNESFEETKQKKFNYEAHWVIEENLRERISELKKEINTLKGNNEKITAERDSIESQLIRVKTEWANAELNRAKQVLSPRNGEYSDSD